MTKVLIVDDAKFIRLQLRQVLESNGYDVVGEAENGKVALKKIQELRPDIVTLDVTMPEMDGLECMKAIKKNGLFASGHNGFSNGTGIFCIGGCYEWS